MEKKENAIAKVEESNGLFTKYQRDAKLLLMSSFLPDHFSKEPDQFRRIANVCVALEMAARFKKFSPLTVLQQIYFIGGAPAWKSSFIMTLLKSQGLKVTFEEEGDWTKPETNPKTRAKAKDADGFIYYSTWIDLDLVKKEGWDKKTGSKWLSMPAQMARYRSSTFLARAYWPELLCGYYTTDEQADIQNINAPEKTYAIEAEFEAPEPVKKDTTPECIKECNNYNYADGPSQTQFAAARQKLFGSLDDNDA